MLINLPVYPVKFYSDCIVLVILCIYAEINLLFHLEISRHVVLQWCIENGFELIELSPEVESEDEDGML